MNRLNSKVKELQGEIRSLQSGLEITQGKVCVLY